MAKIAAALVEGVMVEVAAAGVELVAVDEGSAVGDVGVVVIDH